MSSIRRRRPRMRARWPRGSICRGFFAGRTVFFAGGYRRLDRPAGFLVGDITALSLHLTPVVSGLGAHACQADRPHPRLQLGRAIAAHHRRNVDRKCRSPGRTADVVDSLRADGAGADRRGGADRGVAEPGRGDDRRRQPRRRIGANCGGLSARTRRARCWRARSTTGRKASMPCRSTTGRWRCCPMAACSMSLCRGPRPPRATSTGPFRWRMWSWASIMRQS